MLRLIEIVVLERKVQKQNSSMHFRSFIIISSWKRAWPIIWEKILNPLYSRMLCAKYYWNWSCEIWEFLLFFQSIFAIIVIIWKGRELSFKQTLMFFTKVFFCLVWLKLANWFWRRIWTRKQFTDRHTYGERMNGLRTKSD